MYKYVEHSRFLTSDAIEQLCVKKTKQNKTKNKNKKTKNHQVELEDA